MALVVALLLVAGLVSAAIESADDGSDSPSNVAVGQSFEVDVNQPPPALEGQPGEIAREVHTLMRFVQQARGLPFKQAVNVALLGDADFRDRLMGDGDTDDDSDVTERVLRALGLLERGVDLDEATESLLGAAVAGYYDPAADDLVVRGEALTASVRRTFVHELTHALQDQHFDIDSSDDTADKDKDEADAEQADPLPDDGGEGAEAFKSLIEGDAVRIERTFTDSLPIEEQKAAELEETQAAIGISPSTPRILLELIGFPYVYGPEFATKVFESGGQARLDAAYVDAKPASTEHILHPDRYLAGATTREIDAPTVDETVIDEGVLGEYGLALVLARLVGGPSALTAAEGWGGDRYVAWRDGDAACVRTKLAMDTAKDATEVVAALRAGAQTRDRMTVTPGRAAITITMCG